MTVDCWYRSFTLLSSLSFYVVVNNLNYVNVVVFFFLTSVYHYKQTKCGPATAPLDLSLFFPIMTYK